MLRCLGCAVPLTRGVVVDTAYHAASPTLHTRPRSFISALRRSLQGRRFCACGQSVGSTSYSPRRDAGQDETGREMRGEHELGAPAETWDQPEPGAIAWTRVERLRRSGAPQPAEQEAQRQTSHASLWASISARTSRGSYQLQARQRRRDHVVCDADEAPAYLEVASRRALRYVRTHDVRTGRPRASVLVGRPRASVLVGRPRASAPVGRSRGPRGPVRRPAGRRRVTRSRAPAGDSSGEPGPGPLGPGYRAHADFRYGVLRLADVFANGVSPAAFHAAVDRHLGADLTGGARWQIFMRLGDEPRAAFWRTPRPDLDDWCVQADLPHEPLEEAA